MTTGHPTARYAPPGARGVDLRDRPTTSLVVVSQSPLGTLRDALASGRLGSGEEHGEILVVRAAGTGDLAAPKDALPGVRFVEAPGADSTTLRVVGLTHATGAVVEFCADVVPVDAGAAGQPVLSVIVPAHQAEQVLDRTLGALAASDLARESWELIVVDDASTDRTELVGAAYADVIVRLAGNPHGPAYARNRGAEASRGACLVFVDADVTVHPDALSRIARRFADDAELSAVFGSYDVTPSGQALASQYRNLLHHFVHLRHAGPAETFWSGLGAIRADAFRDIGMFDEWHYSRPQIEDIELGRRLRKRGYGILLDPEIQGTHLKEWTFRNIVATDFKHRGVPWMWLILHEGGGAGGRTLNVGRIEQVCTGLAGLALLAVLGAALLGEIWPLPIAAAAVVAVALVNLPFYWYLRRNRSLPFAIGILPLHVTYYVVNVVAAAAGWLVFQALGAPSPPPERDAAAAVGISTWPPPIRRPRQSTWSSRRTGTAPNDEGRAGTPV